MNQIAEKIANPLNFYNNPHDVEHDEGLSVEEKVKILISWLNDIELRQTAEAENMPSTHDPRDHHVALIERLLRAYKNTPPA